MSDLCVCECVCVCVSVHNHTQPVLHYTTPRLCAATVKLEHLSLGRNRDRFPPNIHLRQICKESLYFYWLKVFLHFQQGHH